MQQREKILLLVFGAVLVGALGVLVLPSWIIEPVSNARRNLKNAEGDLKVAKSDMAAALAKERDLNDASLRCLPSDKQDAERVYLQWVTDLAEAIFTDRMEISFESQSASRNKGYIPIRVSIHGEAYLDEVREFQYRINQADLMQRVVSTRLAAEQHRLGRNKRGPTLEVTIAVEALSMTNSKHRGATLFPRCHLTEALSKSNRKLSIDGTSGFPKKTPFRVRVGREYVQVVGVAGTTWTVERGIDSSEPGDHQRDDVVELAVVSEEMAKRTLRDFDAIVAMHPFAKPEVPREYKPSLSKIGDQVVYLGSNLRARSKASDIDPDLGEPRYRIAKGTLEGMTLDAQTGGFVWEPAESQKLGKFPVTIEVTAGQSDKVLLSETFVITYREPNHAPTIADIENPSVFPGQEVKFAVKGSDPDAANILTYSLGSGAPEGATIDAKTGEFTWAVAESVKPGDYEVTVKATDDGTPQTMSAEKTVKVTVEDNIAQFVYFVGTVTVDGERKAWLRDRKNEVDVYVREGVPFEYAGIKGFALVISRQFLLVQVGDETMRLKVGTSLRDLEPFDYEPAAH